MGAVRKKGILALDIDGTAVGDDYRMGEATKRAILLARKAGYVTVFVTGRRDIDMLTLDKDSLCVDYLILNNGGKIVCCDTKEILYNHRICQKDCLSLMEYCLEQGLELHVCDGGRWFVNIVTESTREYAKELNTYPKLYCRADEVCCAKGIEGFMALQGWQQIGSYIEKRLPNVTYVLSEPDCMDIMASGVSKWDGIRRLAAIEQLTKDNIIAVGNFYNDLDMIRHATVGVAAANSPKEVKAQADYVTDRTNNQDCVAEVVEIFCGIPVFEGEGNDNR
ncbi:MAG: Cof-type HAD-IIB family hydrolase [Dorea sp.]|jgi:Cof subfamily protein (haloacid dehalogenase superfamily)|nr:Cof-type HAD-IIB family hydrolase [Dorea sp.]